MTGPGGFSRRLGRRLRRLLRREDGTATVEFVIMVPIFMLLFVSNFEVSMIMIRQMMLDRGLDLAMRELRLGTWPNPTTAILKQEICSHTAGLISDCENQMMLELIPVPAASWTLPGPNATCKDRSADLEPATTFDAGAQNQLMVVRACVLIDPFFPGTELALMLERNPGDGMPLAATSGFVNEPGTGS
ncbi:TadE/TadG family type IV pilus assembly protein [Actibacterium sp. D379-3]